MCVSASYMTVIHEGGGLVLETKIAGPNANSSDNAKGVSLKLASD